MIFGRNYDSDLAQASYLLGCQQTGEAIVVDPQRDVSVYVELAAQHNLRIVAVTETHIHADYLSGARELAARTGATLYLSDEGGPDWQYGFAHEGLRHGGEIKLGSITLRALHTPGHTPEHLSFLVTDGAASEQPCILLSGDFVFVGDVGRPDLLDETETRADTREPLARQLFASLKREFWTLPDHLQVWPGHGAGSACGKALGAVPSSTVGYERLVAWWAPYLERDDEADFVAALLEGQPEAPSYFGRMKRHNRDGPPLLGDRSDDLEVYPAASLEGQLGQSLLLIDTRPRQRYAYDAVPGSVHLPLGKSLATYAAYVIDPELEQRGLVLLVGSQAEALAVRTRLQQVGIDNVVGFTEDTAGLGGKPVPVVAPGTLHTVDHPYLLDVRARSEYDAGHLPGARQLHAGQVLAASGTLPEDRTIVTYCQSGARNTVVSSALRAAGFSVTELEGSFAAWQAAGQPVARD